MANHLIVRQTFHLSVSSQLKKQNIMEDITRMNRELILPIAERVLDSYGGGAAHYRFDTIEIDLGTISAEDFARKFEDKLHEQIRDRLPGGYIGPGKVDRSNISLPYEKQALSSHGETFPGKPANGDPNEPSSGYSTARYLDTLVYFLNTGLLPWWVHREEKNVIGHFEEVFRKNPEEVILTLRKNWNPRTQHRFYQQFPKNALRLLFHEIGVKYLSIYSMEEEVRKHLAHLIPQSMSWDQLEKTIISSAMENSGGHEKREELYREISRKLEKAWLSGNLSFARELPALLKCFGAKSREIESVVNYFNSRNQKRPIKYSSKTDEKKIPEQQIGKGQKREIVREQKDAGPLVEKKSVSEELPEEGIYIGNSGAVILWPFLREFFESQNLIDKTTFLNAVSREKAVLWLQYLVTGELSFPEYDLSLNKILCGWPPEETLPAQLELNEEEIRKSEELLQNIMEQWKAIGKVSISGFRESFLLREGRLKKNDFGWQLKVERKPYDLLLDRLPWSFGLIKFKWMNQPLFVEW